MRSTRFFPCSVYLEAVTFEFKFEANKRLNKFCERYILPEFMILFVIDECVDPMKRRKTSFPCRGEQAEEKKGQIA